MVFVKRRAWYAEINSTPCFKWNDQNFNYKLVRIFGTLGFRHVQNSGKVVEKDLSLSFLDMIQM